MIKIENDDVYGFEHAIRGMRNPKNSWERSDSHWEAPRLFCDDGDRKCECGDTLLDMIYNLSEGKSLPGCMRETFGIRCPYYNVGEADRKLMRTLANAGNDHGKFMRMIVVYADITAPLYWWKEFDQYKVGTVTDSCSTMHKIDSRDLTLEDFSTDHMCEEDLTIIADVIYVLNERRQDFVNCHEKQDWWSMIQLLPTSYNQKRTVMMNYAVLRNMYAARKNHKLDEWHALCDWMKNLPESELITGEWK